MAETAAESRKAIDLAALKVAAEEIKQQCNAYADQQVENATGVSFATEAEVTEMLDEVFGAAAGEQQGG